MRCLTESWGEVGVKCLDRGIRLLHPGRSRGGKRTRRREGKGRETYKLGPKTVKKNVKCLARGQPMCSSSNSSNCCLFARYTDLNLLATSRTVSTRSLLPPSSPPTHATAKTTRNYTPPPRGCCHKNQSIDRSMYQSINQSINQRKFCHFYEAKRLTTSLATHKPCGTFFVRFPTTPHIVLHL